MTQVLSKQEESRQGGLWSDPELYEYQMANRRVAQVRFFVLQKSA